MNVDKQLWLATSVCSEVSGFGVLNGLIFSEEASEIDTVFCLQLCHGNQQELLPHCSDRVSPSNQEERSIHIVTDGVST